MEKKYVQTFLTTLPDQQPKVQRNVQTVDSRQTQKVSKTWLAVFYLARYVTANNRKNYRNKPQCANPCNSQHEGLLLLQYLFLSLQLSDWKKETAPILRWFFMKRKRHFLVLSRKLKKTFALLYTIVYNYITKKSSFSNHFFLLYKQ